MGPAGFELVLRATGHVPGPQPPRDADDGSGAGPQPTSESDTAAASTKNAGLQTLMHRNSIAQPQADFDAQFVEIETPPRRDWILGHFSPKHVLPTTAVTIPRIPICGYGVWAYLT